MPFEVILLCINFVSCSQLLTSFVTAWCAFVVTVHFIVNLYVPDTSKLLLSTE